ncbi:MAG: hypothetical protein LC732_09815 [Acidobacteria bacterium]|nr:hypothetical protein [Acidobacteriota bacterium]
MISTWFRGSLGWKEARHGQEIEGETGTTECINEREWRGESDAFRPWGPRVLSAVAASRGGGFLFLSSTDHLSDRELYEKLLGEILLEPVTIDPQGKTGFTFIDILGGWSNEDTEIYLRYYADEETRGDWADDYGAPIPPKEKPPYDRDRHLPGYGEF